MLIQSHYLNFTRFSSGEIPKKGLFIRLKRVCSGGGAGQVSEHAAAEHYASDEQAENYLQEYQYFNLHNISFLDIKWVLTNYSTWSDIRCSHVNHI